MVDDEIKELLHGLEPIDIRTELFKKGDYDFIVTGENEHGVICSHEKQREALGVLRDNITEIFMYGGAAGGAKSWTGAVWLLFMCILYPGTRWFIARNQLKDIVDSCFNTFKEVAKIMGFTDYKFNANKNWVKFGNGSQINFVEIKYKPSDPMFEDLGSVEYTGGWIEEAGEINETGANVLMSRVGRWQNTKYNLKRKIFITCNPKKNWLYYDFYKPSLTDELPITEKFLQAFISDNPFLPEDYVKGLRRLCEKDKVQRERLLNGNWDYEDSPDSLCDYEMIEQIFDNDHVPQGKIYLTADIARLGSDLAVICVWRGWRMIHMETRAVSKTTEIQSIINLLRRKYLIPKNQCIADEDGIGCLTNDTEVLTSKGWKNAIEITMFDEIISKNKFGFKEVCSLYKIIHHENEKFIKINDSVSFTSTHAHFYKTRKEYGIKKGYWDDIVEKGRFYNDTFIKENDTEHNFFFSSTIRNMPNGGLVDLNNSLTISDSVFFRFLGWYLSEGCLDGYNNKNIIQITQSRKSIHNDDIEEVLNLMGVNWTKFIYKEGELFQYKFQHRNMFEWIKDNCYTSKENKNCYTKKLPLELKETTKDKYLLFCESFIKGDGYYHKGIMQFVSSSKKMIDDIQEGLFMCGIRSNIYIKAKKGSESQIFGRKIIRTTDVFLLSELKVSSTFKIESKKEYYDKAVNLKIDNETRALLVRIDGHVFWTHNGGVVDNCGILGFMNGSKPIKEKGVSRAKKERGIKRVPLEMPNYRNLQVQCLYHLADIINEGKLWIMCDVATKVKEDIMAELDQIRSKISDTGKLDCKSKSDIKIDLRRSPDYRDAILMRVYFDLKQTKRKMAISRPRTSV